MATARRPHSRGSAHGQYPIVGRGWSFVVAELGSTHKLTATIADIDTCWPLGAIRAPNADRDLGREAAQIGLILDMGGRRRKNGSGHSQIFGCCGFEHAVAAQQVSMWRSSRLAYEYCQCSGDKQKTNRGPTIGYCHVHLPRE